MSAEHQVAEAVTAAATGSGWTLNIPAIIIAAAISAFGGWLARPAATPDPRITEIAQDVKAIVKDVAELRTDVKILQSERPPQKP